MHNKEQVFKVLKWILRFFIYIMIIIIIFDFTNLPSGSSVLEHNIKILIHVLVLGIATYGLVHFKEL
ncbi:MAG: hypothetical protein K0S47_4685 [Herbinix sp.]|jgi:hypothetical protein|nr:hypothetical protein [Herbinix sp.]MDF2544967.1 hypothetical protein [Herbinix sp.]